MKKLAKVGYWMWLFPFLVLVTTYQAATQFATYLFHAPMTAWSAATEAVNEQ